MTVLANAQIVLPDRVVRGSLVLRDRVIEAVDEGLTCPGEAIDCEGDFLIPGIVDVHTDNLERQVLPRENARWPSRSALLAHDGQCAAAGVTTVLDALCVGDLGFKVGRVQTCRDGVADLDAMAETGLLKSEHFLHLRCELPSSDMLEELEPAIGSPLLRIVSVMDHSPGSGQYANLDNYRAMRRREGRSDDVIERHIGELREQRAHWRDHNRKTLLAYMSTRKVPLASHDDRTEAEVEQNFRDGIRISEFPVHMDAARAAHERGMVVVVGAPNLVRGGSHSGNVAASELLEAGVVDVLASDYVPVSLLDAAFLAARQPGMTLPRAIGLVTGAPARMCRLHDRGRIEQGLSADLVRVHLHEGTPVVRQVWRGGERVA